jgi:hypothetical protein
MHELEAQQPAPNVGAHDGRHVKDAILDWLSERANVAQFVSFGPDLAQRYCRVRGFDANHAFETLEAAAASLLRASADGSVNIRSFTPENPKSREFIYGVREVERAAAEVQRLAQAGLYTIVNETVNVNDGGVSGVCVGEIIEFAPGDTPRCVEKPGTASLPRAAGLKLLEKVYQFRPSLDYPPGARVEFSLHPLRRGFRHEHTIVWELEEVGSAGLSPDLRWPNIFSRFIGDKAFGLLVGDMLGAPVPLTTVFSRGVAPFTFGERTGTGEFWIRTCPVEQDPGRYTTRRGWLDPFRLMADEDPEGTHIASILSQEGVAASFSGSLVTDEGGAVTIEGVRGFGDEFMVGQAGAEELPEEVRAVVTRLFDSLSAHLGPVRMEWVHDGRAVWLVQLHRGATQTSGSTIYPGAAPRYHAFRVEQGIEALRALISEVQGSGEGIVLVGNVGVTSHFGDLLRRARIPSHIERT